MEVLLFKNRKLFLMLSLSILFLGCAEKRPIKNLPPEAQRIEKSFFTKDPFYFNVTIVGASTETDFAFTGSQTFGGNSLIQFQIGEKEITANFIDPRYNDRTSLKEPLLVFPIKEHIDVEREKNADEEKTHRIVETTKERSWKERQWVKIDFDHTKLLPVDLTELQIYEAFGCVQESGSDVSDLQYEPDSLNLKLRKTYKKTLKNCRSSRKMSRDLSETFSVEYKISFLKQKSNPNFKPTTYDGKRLQKQVGIYKTTIKKFNERNLTQEQTYAIHWDPNQKIVYYLSPDFPKDYASLVQGVFDRWNEVLKDPKVVGKPLLELRKNSGQELGDIRYNFIVWINDPIEKSLLGYGPSRWNPFTGEIINSNVYLFAGNSKQLLQRIQDEGEIEEAKIDKKGRVSDPSLDAKALPISQATSSSSTSSISLSEFKTEIQPYSLESVFKENRDPKTLEGALEAFNQDGRCYYPAEISDKITVWHKNGFSEEEILKRLIVDTLAHELGHNLGLRHNFKGSYDKKHFISTDIHTSSVMDYLDVDMSENGKPGPYDKEALIFAFNGHFNFDENYLFCTDEDVDRDPFCNRFDLGSSATEISTHLENRYLKTYRHRNLRGKRTHFSDSWESDKAYRDHLVRYYFLPLRQFVDYYFHIAIHRTTLEGDFLSEKNQKILMDDLLQATIHSYNFFATIITDSKHPYRDIVHPYLFNDELLIRGTRIDKLLATDVLTTRRFGIEPWDSNRATYFDDKNFQAPFIHLINSTIFNDGIPPLVLFTLAQRFMNRIPTIGHTWDFSDLLNVNAYPLTEENRNTFHSQKDSIAYLIDHSKRIIYVTKQNLPWIDSKLLPVTKLIESYKKFKTLRKILGKIEGDEQLEKLKTADLDLIEEVVPFIVKPIGIPTKIIVIVSKERLNDKFNEIKTLNPDNENLLRTINTLQERIKNQELSDILKKEIGTIYELFTTIYGPCTFMGKKELYQHLTQLFPLGEKSRFVFETQLKNILFKIEILHELYTGRTKYLE